MKLSSAKFICAIIAFIITTNFYGQSLVYESDAIVTSNFGNNFYDLFSQPKETIHDDKLEDIDVITAETKGYNFVGITNCPIDISVSSDTGQCGAIVTYPAITSNAGNIINQTSGLPSGSLFPVGVTTNTFEERDGLNNLIDTCTFTVTVNDNENPVIAPAPANITVECITDVPAMTSLSWTDNCDAGGNVTGSDSALVGGTCGGQITRTWNVTDSNGNNAITRTQTITIDDTIAPVIAAAPANIVVNCISDVPAMTNLTWTDNCDAGGNVTGSDSALVGNTYNGTITRTWNVADACGNNAITRTQVITINDTIDPIIAPAPANITVECITDVPAMTSLSWTDNCDAGGNVTGSDSALVGGTCGGQITRTWNVTDSNGNNAITRTQTITIDDTIAPVIAAAPANIVVNCISDVPAMTNLTWTDNCDAGGNVTGSDSALVGNTYNGTITRTWNVADACGNNAITRTQVITINDTTQPTAICQDFSITLNASGNASITTADIDNGSFDNCSGVSLTASQINFTCANIGTNNVTLTVTDDNNNVSSCIAVVTVVDPADTASVSITVDNNTICNSEDATFTANPTDGGSSPIYEWFVNGVSQGTTGSPTFTPFPALSDNDEVYVQMQSNLSSCVLPKQSNSIFINVNPLPVVSGPAALCVNSNVTLSPATSGWISNSAFASVDNSGVVTGLSSGNASFTYTDANGCSSDLSITINDVPNVTSPASICVSETSNLSPNTGGTWISNNTTRATISNSGVITGVAPGFVTFTFTDANGCSSTTSQVEILAKPIFTSVTTSNDPICSGETSILSANVAGAGTNNEVIVNYNFNSGSSYATLDGQEVPGISCDISYVGFHYAPDPGTATQGSAYVPESIAGNAIKQLDNNWGNEGYWIFTVDGVNINNYQNFSVYFQTKRATTAGTDKYVNLFYRVNGTGGLVLIDRVLINNTVAGTQWREIIYSIPALANNPNQLEIMIGADDGYRGLDFSQNPDILIDNVQIRASSSPDSFTYSWVGNTASAGLPVGADIPSSTNSSISVNPDVTTTYTVTAYNSNGCTETDTVTVNVLESPDISIAAEYCPVDDPMTAQDESNMVQLVASSLTPVTSWEWLTTPVQTGSTIFVDSAGLYQVVATAPNGCTESITITVAQERIFNGDFSNTASTIDGDFGPDAIDNLNAIGFDYEEDYASPFNAGYRYVVNPVLNQNMISVTPDSGPLNPSNFRSVLDHTSDVEAQFLAVNGSATTLAAWRQEIPVEPGELYYFSAWGIDISDTSNASLNPCDLRFRINGVLVGPTLDLIKGNDWERIYGTWNSGAATTAILEIVNINTATQGNNFGIDDISFATLSTFITLTSAVGTDNQTICQNTPITDISYDVGGGLNAPTITGLPAGLTTNYDGIEFTISGTPTVFGTFNYTLTTTSSCDVKSESGTIIIDEAPIVTIQSIVSPICSADNSIAVNATLSGSATSGTWSTSGTGTFSGPSADGSSATYNFGINETGTTTLTFTSNTPASTCIAATDTYDITITGSIDANAGINIDNSASDCANTTVTLAANNVVGQWTVTSAQPANTYNFSDATAYNSTFTGESGETYTLQWEATNTAPCNNTTDTITVTFADCGTSLVFDGIEDYISFGNSYELDNSPFSIETWIKPDNLSGTQTIVSKRNSSLNSGYDLSLINNRIYFRWNNQSIFVSQPITTTKWYHIAVTFNGSNTYVIYVDGFPLITSTTGSPPTSNSNKSIIGAMDTNSGNPINYFGGGIDELRFWNVTLSENQIREMMNQEIEANGSNVSGVEVPLDITGNLQWNSLIGYYQMRFGSQSIVANGFIEDISTISATQGKLNNMTTEQSETAPIPYISGFDNAWDNSAAWVNGNVQQLPNSRVNSINGFEQTWNIVRTASNVSATRPANVLNRTTVLGLLVDNDRLSILNDQHIIITKYLKIDGTLDLVGESQLLQPMGSIVDYSGNGLLERDQQGTSNLYNFNYWSSPVSNNGLTYTIGSVLNDGTNVTNPQPANWGNGFDANPLTNPKTLSRRWLYLFENYPENAYADWNGINENTNIPIGLGYTMKGSGSATANQNYTFIGQPNNGTITQPVTGGYQALIGNPYPSAIDANEFINDNSGVLLDGTLYFWEHAATNSSHLLSQYEGGYAARNLTAGIPAVSPPEINGEGSANKIPGRYVPVAQGFFVTGNATGGNILFQNSQRLFFTEQTANSIFFRGSNPDANTSPNGDEDKYIRLDFISPENAIRHLVIGFMNSDNATDGIDYGYDGINQDNFPSDMSFNIEGEKFVIQGVGNFDDTKSYPLDINLAQSGPIEIAINSIENFTEDVDVFIFDNLLNTYTQINHQNFQLTLDAGNYTSRFYLVFQKDASLSVIKDEFENIVVRYLHNTDEIYVKTPPSIELKQLYLINIAGQTVKSWNSTNLPMSHEIKIPVKNMSEGSYILKAETNTSTFNRKVIIKY
jgi:hypothetical protein